MSRSIGQSQDIAIGPGVVVVAVGIADDDCMLVVADVVEPAVADTHVPDIDCNLVCLALAGSAAEFDPMMLGFQAIRSWHYFVVEATAANAAANHPVQCFVGILGTHRQNQE